MTSLVQSSLASLFTTPSAAPPRPAAEAERTFQDTLSKAASPPSAADGGRRGARADGAADRGRSADDSAPATAAPRRNKADDDAPRDVAPGAEAEAATDRPAVDEDTTNARPEATAARDSGSAGGETGGPNRQEAGTQQSTQSTAQTTPVSAQQAPGVAGLIGQVPGFETTINPNGATTVDSGAAGTAVPTTPTDALTATAGAVTSVIDVTAAAPTAGAAAAIDPEAQAARPVASAVTANASEGPAPAAVDVTVQTTPRAETRAGGDGNDGRIDTQIAARSGDATESSREPDRAVAVTRPGATGVDRSAARPDAGPAGGTGPVSTGPGSTSSQTSTGGDATGGDRSAADLLREQLLRPEPAARSTAPAEARAVEVEGRVQLENLGVRPMVTEAPRLAVTPGATLAGGEGTKAVVTETATVTPTPTIDAAFPGRIVRGMSTMISQNGGVMRMTLTPPALGELRVQMSIVQGTVTAQFSATTEEAHALIKSNLGALQRSLEGQGLNVDRLTAHLTPGDSSGGARSGAGDQENGGRGDRHDAAGHESRGRGERGESSAHRDGREDRAVGFAHDLASADGPDAVTTLSGAER